MQILKVLIYTQNQSIFIIALKMSYTFPAPIERASSPRSMGIGINTGVGNIRGQAMSQASGSSHSQQSLSR